MEVTYSEIALGGVGLSLCRRCAGFISGWLSADIAVGTRQRGGFEGDFTQVGSTVRTNLRCCPSLASRLRTRSLPA